MGYGLTGTWDNHSGVLARARAGSRTVSGRSPRNTTVATLATRSRWQRRSSVQLLSIVLLLALLGTQLVVAPSGGPVALVLQWLARSPCSGAPLPC